MNTSAELPIELPDYRDGAPLSVGARTTVFRAVEASSGKPVVIKALRPEHALPEAMARLRYEHQVASSVQHPSIPRPQRLVDGSGTLAIVYEDIGGLSLRAHMAQGALSTRDCLSIARQVAQALSCLHEHNIVHRDVTPQNIVFNPASGCAQLIDLGIASRLQRERSSVDATSLFEGTLAFVSPEQTGRLNRSVDARSDLYSLGCTLYVMFVGEAPFTAQEPLELIHAILARQPAVPREVAPAVPQAVSDIIMTLVSKSPDARYQSAAGLLADLDTALQALQADGSIAPFTLRTQDFDETFKLPEQLFGREREIDAMLAAFDDVARRGDNASVWVRGNSGEGKSALVHELQRALVQHRALYGAGKFDPLSRDVPYSAFNTACAALTRQALARSPQTLDEIRGRLTGALGKAGGVLTSVLPAFELIMGPQGPFHPLGPKESEARFLVIFQEAIQALATREHPLVLFVDDLQWADPQSIKLMRILATPGLTPHVLLVAAYRALEVDANHPVTALMQELRTAGARMHEVELSPLRVQDIEAMVVAALGGEHAQAQPLAVLLAEKTAGNAFFVGEFLRHLHQTGRLRYDRGARRWVWQLAEIQALAITDNVVDLMLGRLRDLPADCQQSLAYAAAVGSTFDLGLLALARQAAPQSVAQQLWPAVNSGIIQPQNENYKYASDNASANLARHAVYKFAHDKVRQAAEDLAPTAERAHMRCTLGVLLMRGLPREQLEAHLFDVASHLQAGEAHLTEADAAQALEMLLLAGRRAKDANACAAALAYLQTAVKRMPTNAWETAYEAFHALQMDLAECEDVIGQSEAASRRILTVLERCRSPVMRLHTQARYIPLLASQNQLELCLDVGVAALREVGVRLPRHPNPLHLLRGIFAVQRARAGRTIASLYDLEALRDPLQDGILSVLGALYEPAFQVNVNLAIALSLHGTVISMTHGLSRWACLPLATYGVVCQVVLKQTADASEVGNLALRLVDRFGNKSPSGMTLVTVAALLSHFGDSPLSMGVTRGERAFRSSIEGGELDASFRGACVVTALQFIDGKPLPSVLARAEDFAQTFKLRGDPISREVMSEYMQTVRCLLGRTPHTSSLGDAEYDEERHVQAMRAMQGKAPLADYHNLKMQLHFLAGELDEAEAHGTGEVDIEVALRGNLMVQQYCLYLALTTSELLLRQPRKRALARRWRLYSLHRKLCWWAKAGPVNFAADLTLAEAQMAQMAGRTHRAHTCFEAAARAYALAKRFRQEALTHELWGRMCVRLGLMRLAEACMRNARAAYVAWGAIAKIIQLEGEFPQWLTANAIRDSISQTHSAHATTHSTTGESAVEGIDLRAALQAMQMMSLETHTHRLVRGLLRNIATYVGAERAILVMPRQQELQWVAEAQVADAEHDDQPLPAPAPIDDTVAPLPLLRYAQRTRQAVVIDDATGDSEHSQQAYFQRHSVKSVLCLPLIHQAQVKALVYAENSLVGYAFNTGRVTLCRMLGLQTLVSLENAMLYAQLEQQVEARTTELRDAQARVVRLEKDATEQQMAGGFAHEMRNTLSAASHALGTAMGENTGGPGLSQELERLFAGLAAGLQQPGVLDADALAQLRESLAEVTATLGDIMALTHESVHRALEVTSMIMEYSRLGLTRRGTDAVDLRQVVERIGDEAREEMSRAQVALRMDLSATQTFYGSEAHFYSVVRNLVNNARDALTECEDGRARAIDVRLERGAAGLVLRVSDNARGMSEPTLKRIFEPFFSTKLETGLGLGLSMVRKLVELYSGRIDVHSRPGEGTVFTVTYPDGQ